MTPPVQEDGAEDRFVHLVGDGNKTGTEQPLDAAPPHNLPDWAECAMRVDNSDFIAQRVREGGYGNEGGVPVATELHRFIYEYHDVDPYRSAWFMHRLELVLNEARAELLEALQQLVVAVEILDVTPYGNLQARRHFAAIDRARSLLSKHGA